MRNSKLWKAFRPGFAATALIALASHSSVAQSGLDMRVDRRLRGVQSSTGPQIRPSLPALSGRPGSSGPLQGIQFFDQRALGFGTDVGTLASRRMDPRFYGAQPLGFSPQLQYQGATNGPQMPRVVRPKGPVLESGRASAARAREEFYTSRAPQQLQGSKSVYYPGAQSPASQPPPPDSAQAAYTYPGWAGAYFPDSCAWYGFYSPQYVQGVTIISPYISYFGACPPYIAGVAYYTPPAYTYIPEPAYSDGNFAGWHETQDAASPVPQASPAPSYGVGDTAAPVQSGDPALTSAVDDIAAAWTSRNIDLLQRHLPESARIAVVLNGKYQYSLNPGDYADLTRDTFRTTHTVRFSLDTVTRKGAAIYSVSGRHVYTNARGEEHTVYVSYVLEKKVGVYVITQVSSAPEKQAR